MEQLHPIIEAIAVVDVDSSFAPFTQECRLFANVARIEMAHQYVAHS